jgi:hypothetical protein
MDLLKNLKLITLTETSLIIILIAIAFIMVVSGKGYGISPSPVISAYPVLNVAAGTNITVSGQNFTPNGIALLYVYSETYLANVDKNGNASWSYREFSITPYSIYALDGNSTDRKSNEITIYPLLNDATMAPTTSPTPAPTTSPALPMGTTFTTLIAAGAVLLIVGLLKKK